MDDISGMTTQVANSYMYDQIVGHAGHGLKVLKDGIDIGSVEYVRTKECYVFTSRATTETKTLSPSLLRSKNLITQYF